MSGRTTTYDEIQMEVLCMHGLSAQDRHEMLCYIREFKQSVSQEFLAKLPERLKTKVQVRVS